MSAADRGSMRIVPAGIGEIPELLRSMEACAGAPHWTAANFESLIRGSENGARRGVVFALRGEQGTLCGWLAGAVQVDSAELEFVVVETAFRGAGLGRLLVEHWLRWAAEQGAGEALLEVRASNVAALELYRRMGFQMQGRRRGYYSEPMEDAVLMCVGLPRRGLGEPCR